MKKLIKEKYKIQDDPTFLYDDKAVETLKEYIDLTLKTFKESFKLKEKPLVRIKVEYSGLNTLRIKEIESYY